MVVKVRASAWLLAKNEPMVAHVASVNRIHDPYSIHGAVAIWIGTKSLRKPIERARPALENVSTDLSKFSELETSRL